MPRLGTLFIPKAMFETDPGAVSVVLGSAQVVGAEWNYIGSARIYTLLGPQFDDVPLPSEPPEYDATLVVETGEVVWTRKS
jgi:hypothetical protein